MEIQPTVRSQPHHSTPLVLHTTMARTVGMLARIKGTIETARGKGTGEMRERRRGEGERRGVGGEGEGKEGGEKKEKPDHCSSRRRKWIKHCK